VLGYRGDQVPGVWLWGRLAAGEPGAEEPGHASSLQAHHRRLGKVQIASPRGCLFGGFWGPAKMKVKCV